MTATVELSAGESARESRTNTGEEQKRGQAEGVQSERAEARWEEDINKQPGGARSNLNNSAVSTLEREQLAGMTSTTSTTARIIAEPSVIPDPRQLVRVAQPKQKQPTSTLLIWFSASMKPNQSTMSNV